MREMKSRERRELVIKCMEGYRYAARLISMHHLGYRVIEEVDENEYKTALNRFQAIKANIESILDQLSEEEQLIIDKESCKFRKKDWWSTYYSRSTFYRRRDLAFERFIMFYSF